MKNIIEVKELKKRYGANSVLKGISEYKQKGISISEIQTDRISLEQNFMNIVRGAN